MRGRALPKASGGGLGSLQQGNGLVGAQRQGAGARTDGAVGGDPGVGVGVVGNEDLGRLKALGQGDLAVGAP